VTHRSALAFQAGGFVRDEALYIERPADTELPEALLKGEYCYVLAPRQIGKTSLAARTQKKLGAAGSRCISVDFNEIGSHATPEEWFYSLVYKVAEPLNLEEQLAEFWDTHSKESLPSRWTGFCREVLLQQVKDPVVIFLDEIDSILSVTGVADDFFASIRALHEKRAEDPELTRLSFCLLGVAAPRDLIQDESRTPFNIGRSIRLEDFTPEETQRMLPGLSGLGHEPKALLEAILAWTDGHPYMTFKVAEALTAEGAGAQGANTAQARVDACVRRLFLDHGRQEDPNLRYAEDRFSRAKRSEQIPKMLRLYRRLLAGERVAAVSSDPVQQEFRLTGMVAERREGTGRWLRVRNRIFATVFNVAWARAQEADRLVAAPLDAWLGRGRSEDLLLRGEVLEQAREWARSREDLTREEREFLDASRELASRTRTRRVLVRILGSALLVLVALVAVLVQKNLSLMKATARLSAAIGQQQGAGAAALEAALTSLVTARQLRAPDPPAAFLGITRGVSDLKSSMPLVGHEGMVRGAAFSPDGARVLTGSADKTARLWDSQSGQLLATLQGHEGSVLSVAFSPDGSRILTASVDKTARLWDSQSGQLLVTLQGHEDSVWRAGFSPDGSRILTGSADKTACLWDSRSGQLLATFPGYDGADLSAAFSPDGSRFLTSTFAYTVRVWDSRSAQLLATLQGHNDKISSMAFSPDGSRVLTASDDDTARLWDSQSGQPLVILEGHEAGVVSAAFSPDGSRVATASNDSTARLWDSRSGQLLATLKGHTNMVWSAAFSPDGARVLTASLDNTPRLWDSQSGQLLAILKGHEAGVESAAFSPDGSRILTASWDNTARVWANRSGQLLATLVGHEGSVPSAAFSPDGSRLATRSHDGTARLWDSRSGQLLVTLKGHTNMVWSVAFSPDGARVVTGSLDNTARLWDSRSGQLLATLQGHEGAVASAAFSPDGSRVVTASDDSTARLWDSQSGQLLASLEGHRGGVVSAAFSPDGEHVLTAGAGNTARVWDSSSGQLLATLKGHEDRVMSAAFSPDGERIVTASTDRTARVWDSRSGQLMATLQGHEERVWSAAFSPDGSRVLTTSFDKTARLWIASPEGWLIEACNLPQFTPSSTELRDFCQPYKGRGP
jgi:WD40 repeat protein